MKISLVFFFSCTIFSYISFAQFPDVPRDFQDEQRMVHRKEMSIDMLYIQDGLVYRAIKEAAISDGRSCQEILGGIRKLISGHEKRKMK